MAQTFYPITPVEVTPDETGKWDTCDVSAHIPAGATGVILHCVNTHTFSARYLGLRKNGSTDDRHPDVWHKTHCWAMIGVDASRIFEAYIENTTNNDIWLVGYTMSGVTFATNADDMSLGVTGSWQPIDCFTEAPSAIGLIFEIDGLGYSDQFGLKKNGSSDDRKYDVMYHSCFGVVIGCDASQICEGYIASTNTNFYLLGYITDGVTFNTNATDLSLGSTGTWLDLTALPDESPVMGIIEVTSHTSVGSYGLRENGSGEDIYFWATWHPWGIVKCDASRIIEGKISTTNVDFFLVGYATAVAIVAPTVTTQDATGLGID